MNKNLLTSQMVDRGSGVRPPMHPARWGERVGADRNAPLGSGHSVADSE